MSNALTLTAAFFYLFLIAACSPSAESINLIRSGRSDYQIVCDEEDPSSLAAAEELQAYLEKSTGVQLSVIPQDQHSGSAFIRLGIPDTVSSRNPLQNGWLRMQARDKNLYLEASDGDYLFYAVYDFLERFAACRWLDPESDFVPPLKEIAVPGDLFYFYQPDIATRTVHSSLFYEYPDFARKHKVTTESFPYYTPGARVHTFHRFLPEARFYQSHPEYYALRNGRRLPTQLCLSNESVLEIVLDSVQAHFERYPDAKVISVSQDDNQQYCTCAACRQIDEEEGTPMGSMIRFVNQVAEHFPNKTISTLAYQYTRSPAKTRPRENVLITLCSIECDRSASIEEKCKAFAEDLNAWREMDAQLRIWDYTTQFTNFLAPFPNFHTLQPNVQLFRNSGARWIFEQHSRNPSELFELRSYLMAKLLWNPDLKADSVLHDFAEHYYQEAAPFVLKYIKTIHGELEKYTDFFLFLYGDPSQAFDAYLSPELLLQYHAFFDSAEIKAAGNPVLTERLGRARLSIDYALLEACRKGAAPELQLIEQGEGRDKRVNPFLAKRLEAFATNCRENNITLMNEMGYTVEEYLQFVEATLERAQWENLAADRLIQLETKPHKYANEDPQTLTDGAFGGSNFYANWLGFEGNDLIAEVDLGAEQEVRFSGLAFLQVVNHLAFLPVEVEYFYAGADRRFYSLGKVVNPRPLKRDSKINDVAYFDLSFAPVQARYLKVRAENLKQPPFWHHGAGLPSWIFADEWIVN